MSAREVFAWKAWLCSLLQDYINLGHVLHSHTHGRSSASPYIVMLCIELLNFEMLAELQCRKMQQCFGKVDRVIPTNEVRPCGPINRD